MYKKIKLCFMGSPQFSIPSLKAIIEAGHEVSVVFTQAPKPANRGKKTQKQPVHEYAESVGLKVLFSNNLKDNIEFLKTLNLDMIIVVAFGYILPAAVINLPRLGCINLHASLLPRWRGAAPIQRAIMNLDEVIGISVMKIVEKLDSGPIMLKKEIKLSNEMNTEDVSNQLSKIGSETISNCLDLIEIGKAKFVEQDHSKATYAKKINKEEAKIIWKEDAQKIIAKINGLYPNSGAWFLFQGERYKILKATLSDLKGQPGSVLDNNLTIACGDKSIKIQEIQRQGKSKQKTTEFLLGSKIKKDLTLS